MNNIIFLMEYKMLSVIKGDINTYFYIHYSGMYTSLYTLDASRGSKCAPSCFYLPGLLNIDGYFSINTVLQEDISQSRERLRQKSASPRYNMIIIKKKKKKIYIIYIYLYLIHFDEMHMIRLL